MASGRPSRKCLNGSDRRKFTVSIEIEKKYRLTEVLRAEVVAALGEFGAKFVCDDVEENTIFSNDLLFERRAMVRIRKTADRSIITFKQRMESISGAKHQSEYETKVDDADATRSILEGIGLRRVLVYEKKRATYNFRNSEIVLDELPFGLFMEIEGPLTAIAEAEMLLGIEDLETESETYPRLTEKFGVKNGDVIESRFRES